MERGSSRSQFGRGGRSYRGGRFANSFDRANRPDASHGQPSSYVRGRGRGSARGRGQEDRTKSGQQKEVREFPFSLLRQLADDYDEFQCRVKIADPGFKMTLDAVHVPRSDRDCDKIDLLLRVLIRALKLDSRDEYIMQIKSTLLEKSPEFLRDVCFRRLLNALTCSLQIQVHPLITSLENYLELCERLGILDPQLAGKLHTDNITTLAKVLPIQSGEEFKAITQSYSQAAAKCIEREQQEKVKESQERQNERLKVSGLQMTTQKPLRADEFRREDCRPTKAMLLTTDVPLRKNYEHGAFDDDEDYLDVQFRLLREDLVTSLRTGRQEFRKNNRLTDSDARLLKNLQITSPCFGRDGITYIIQFDSRSKDHQKMQRYASRNLKFGSLLCLSTDKFKDVMIFAVVAESDECRDKGILELSILPHSEDEFSEIFSKNSALDVDILVSAAYYESYIHVLKALQIIRNVPFSRYIVSVEKDVRLPSYILLDNAASSQSAKQQTSSVAKTEEHCGYDEFGYDEFGYYEFSSDEEPLSEEDSDSDTDDVTASLDMPRINRTSKQCQISPRYKLFDADDNELHRETDITDDQFWPEPTQLGLNHSQWLAFKLALAKEFAVIQGPPGTGKTFVGIKVAHVLFHNLYKYQRAEDELATSFVTSAQRLQHEIDDLRSKNMACSVHEETRCASCIIRLSFELDDLKKERQLEESQLILRNLRLKSCGVITTPMLIVCYTNHALDQFLEGVMKFCEPDDVLRVGGQSKSEKLIEMCGLRSKKQSRRNREFWGQSQIVRDLKVAGLEAMKQLRKADNGFIKPTLIELHPYFQSEILRFSKQYLGNEVLLFFMYWLGCEEAFVNSVLVPNQGVGTEKRTASSAAASSGQAVEDSLIDMDRDDANRRLEDDEYDGDIFQGYGDEESEDSDDEFEIADGGGHGTEAGEREVTTQERTAGKQRFQTEMSSSETLSDLDERRLINKQTPIDKLDLPTRWGLYRKWKMQYKRNLLESISNQKEEYNRAQGKLKALRMQEDKAIMAESKIIAMTTTAAARYREMLEDIGPEVVIIEEAAEVLEAHVVTALSKNCKHLILIGDHQQLKPNPSVYALAKKFNLDLSLFERMINNGVKYEKLNQQHRMRPEISQFMQDIYPDLRDHPDVLGRPEIRGVISPVLFINHQELEESHDGTRSKQNPFEAEYIVELCRYFMRQNYQPSQITIITMYVGQLLTIRSKMPKHEFEGVKITSVDNFQGEENDIILLSLVRSNPEGNLGFVSIENRICVALSRARNGLYVFGNMTMLKESKSVMWQKIIAKAEKAGYVVKDVPVICGPHGCKQVITKPEDFKEKTPQGGCSVKCNEVMACTHVCPQYCHSYDRQHEEFKCIEPCVKIFEPCGHPCPDKCYVKCSPCMVDKPVIMPKCGHDQVIRCYESKHEVPCTFLIEVYCDRCQKTKKARCHDASNYSCDTPCSKQRACGHKCRGSCSQCESGCVKCAQRCYKHLNCGDRCESLCCYPSPCPPCEKTCQLICGHENKCNLSCQEHLGRQCLFDCRKKDGKQGSNYKCFRGGKCKHMKKCQNYCNQPCTFKHCNKRCQPLFHFERPRCQTCKQAMKCMGSCRHPGPCFGFCPKCEKEISTYYKQRPSCVLVKLTNCGHTWPIQELQTELEKSWKSQIEHQKRVLARCPTKRCEKVILDDRFWKYNCLSSEQPVKKGVPVVRFPAPN